MSAVDEPQRWPLITNPLNRRGSINQDGRLVNCYGELEEQTKEYDVVKRPGRVLDPSLPAGDLGMFLWPRSLGYTNLVQDETVASLTTPLFKDTTELGAVT